MQINNNMNSNPNFGMALKVSKGAREILENASDQTIKDLAKAGEELKDTKFWHLNVLDDGTTEIRAIYANAYKEPITFEAPNSEFLRYEAVWSGTPGMIKDPQNYHNSIKFENKQQAIEAYEKLNNWNSSEIERKKDFVLYLEEATAKDEAEKEAARLKKLEHNNMVEDLLNKFGI